MNDQIANAQKKLAEMLSGMDADDMSAILDWLNNYMNEKENSHD